jgi:mycothiol synthase
MAVTALSPDPSPAEVAGVHDVLAAAARADRPADPEPTPAEAEARLRHRSDQHRTLRWLARDGDRVVGYATVRLSDLDNPHLAWAEVTVHPAYRRRGTGTALLRAVLDAVGADGARTGLVGEALEGGPGAAFCAAAGLSQVAVERRSLLRLADVDWADVEAAAAAPHPGYRLVRWTGRCPDELLAGYAAAKTAMNDAPFEEASFTGWAYLPATVRDEEATAARFGRELRVVVAVHEDSGAVAGLTEVFVLPTPRRSVQNDTAVLAAHRGHGLGLWIKADMLVRLRAERPEVAELLTGNAASNEHMLRINTRLGYRMWANELVFEGAVAGVLSAVG